MTDLSHMGLTGSQSDRMVIRDLVEAWVIWRDARQWDRFRTIWHVDGRMNATWTQGGFEDFIARSQAGWDKGVRILHTLSGSMIDVVGDRAIAQTKMTIAQRAEVEGVLSDVVCRGRFYDFFERRRGQWGLVLRQPIYEADRLDAVTPGTAPKLAPDLLARFPEGYRHLAYLQTRIGYSVKTDMPGLDGAAVEQLYVDGGLWLAGGPLRR